MYLSVFGCSGSLHCCVRYFFSQLLCVGFSAATASLVVEHGLQGVQARSYCSMGLAAPW